MAKPIQTAGNKASLRANSGDTVHRVNAISGNLGTIADSLVSTNKSIILAGAVLGGAIITLIIMFMGSSGIKNLKGTWLPVVLVVLGALLVSLNVFFVNPSQGSQFAISFRYWTKKIGNDTKRLLIKPKPYRFAKQDSNRASLEGIYKGRHRFLCIVKVHGSVAQTSFDSDLEYLRNINYASIRALDRSTERVIINKIGSPDIQQKDLAPNATPGMQQRRLEINNAVRRQGRMQTLDTYILLDAPSWQELQKKLNNQFTYFQKGLVVAAQVLQGDQLKATMHDLFS